MQLQSGDRAAGWQQQRHARQAWRTLRARLAPAADDARAPAQAPKHANQASHVPGWRPQRCRCAAGPPAADSAGGGSGGDVVRPSAKGVAPLVPPSASPDLSAASSSGSSSGSSSAQQAAGRAGSSYSEFYKAVNSTHYSAAVQQQQQQQQQATSKSSSSSNGSGNGSSIQQPAQHAEPAAAEDGHLHQTQQASAGVVAAGGAAALTAAGREAPGVEDALRKAQQALAAAESSLSSIHKLRSSQPPSKWAALLQVARSTARAVSVGAFLVASHAFGLGWQWAGATIGALALAALAFKQQTITEAGAVAVAAASLATLGCSLRFGLVLLMVSYSTFKLRQFKEARVAPDSSRPSSGAARGSVLLRAANGGGAAFAQPSQEGKRDWLEIACIAGVPTVLAIVYGAMAGCLDLPLGSLPNSVETWRADLLTLLQGAVLGWYACVCGDAWSTELGALSADQPRLLTTLRPVRSGTHGGVTLLGLSGAAAGGLLTGLLFYCAALLSPTLWVFEAQRAAAMAQWRVVPLGLIAGLVGSLLDSLLGASLQFTGYDTATQQLTHTPGPGVQRISGLRLRWLNDSVVNVLAASATAALTALAALATFG